MSFLARDPRQLFEMLRTNPEMLQQARRTSPQLADAIQRGDFGTENFQLSNKKKTTKLDLCCRNIYAIDSSSIS